MGARRPPSPPPHRRLRAAAVAACMVAAAACTARGTTTTPPTNETSASVGNPAALTWQPCDDGFECALLVVPWDHFTDEGRTMNLPVIRARATDGAHRMGAVVTNPGGPGGSGVAFLRSARTALAALNRSFDLVSFDPRGVAGAQPALRCRQDLDDDLLLLDGGAPEHAAYRQELEAFRRSCPGDQADLARVMGTDQVAVDLEWLRLALGEPSLNYLGFSYGTRLGFAYAHRYGANVRAMVLDGADVIDGRITDSVADQYRAFDRAFDRFVAHCRSATSACATTALGGPDVAFRRIEAALAPATGTAGAAEPSSLPVIGTERRLTRGEFYAGVLDGLYSASLWSELDRALDDAATRTDGTGLQHLADGLFGRRADGGYDNLSDASLAVNCADDPERPGYQEALADGEALASALRWFAPLGRIAFTDCIDWPTPAAASATTAAATASATMVTAPVIVVGSTGDPATPYEWAAALAAALPDATVLTHVGEGHTALFASACVRAVAGAYFFDPAPPTTVSCAD